LLIAAAVLLSVGEGSNKGSTGANADQVLFYGIIPVLIASVLSGLASSLCQWASQVNGTFKFLFKPKFSELINIFICPNGFFYHRLRNTHHT
jgi:UDP-sugar transporter A1/2/3